MKKIKLNSFEQEIEKGAGKWLPVSKEKRDLIESIIENAKKSKNINIRISEFDLERIKDRSSKEGLPYQTLISSVLHKFVTNQLVEEQSILKSIQLLQKTAA